MQRVRLLRNLGRGTRWSRGGGLLVRGEFCWPLVGICREEFVGICQVIRGLLGGRREEIFRITEFGGVCARVNVRIGMCIRQVGPRAHEAKSI